MRRQLKLFDVLCIGINAIVGSGIFLLPGMLAAEAGAWSILMFFACGLLLIPIGLCFAEAGSHVDRNGGPYNYVRKAFGETAGFAIGWIAVVTAIFSFAAVASGLPKYIGSFIPAANEGAMPHAIAVGAILIFTALNMLGVRLGANAINLFTVTKLVPLLFLAIAGLFFISPSAITGLHAPNPRSVPGLMLAVLFIYQGFEVAPVPAGETINSRRAIPIAVMGSLIISGILYMLIQAVVVGAGAAAAGSQSPLADVAAGLMGPLAGGALALGAVISMIGYCSGIAFNAPRFLTVLCEDRFLPAAGARLHPRFGTPCAAALAIGASSSAMALSLDFERLVDMSALAVALQYLFTCISVPRLRRGSAITHETYIMPGGYALPILGAAISLIFISQITFREFVWTGSAVAAGIVVSLIYRALANREGKSQPPEQAQAE